jgi:DNA-binding beta-propeller fold protein YncE
MSSMMKLCSISFVLVFGALFALGCNNGESINDGPAGSLSFHLEAGYDDVVGFQFRVEDSDGNVTVRYVELEEENFPSHLHPGTGDSHRFADAFFVLAPGTYSINVIPMKSEQEQSEDCLPAGEIVEVLENETTEVVLVSLCDMEDNGALDIIVITNHDPVITGLVFDPSKFILTCEYLEVTVEANDPDGDPLTYDWEVTSEPAAAIYDFSFENETMSLFSRTAGDYEVTVTVCDTVEDAIMCAHLTFPIHVQMSIDENQNGVGDECDFVDVVWTDNDDFELGEGDNVVYDDGAIVIDEFIRSQYLWVPSSSADQVVIFDTDTLQAINGSPFDCCDNPSRLGQDADGNVFVTCRNDGRAMKITPNGVVEWDTHLGDMCGPGLRGAVYVPRVNADSLIYVGCSSQGKTFVLNAHTGAVIKTINTRRVYGLAYDGVNVYVASRADHAVQAIAVSTDQIIWTYTGLQPYGIAARDGSVWISSCHQGIAAHIDGASGQELGRLGYNTSGNCGRGVAISPVDGLVYQALSDSDEIVQIDPNTHTIIGVFNTNVTHAIGVDVDAENRIYAIGRYSNTVARMDANGNNVVVFGGNDLSGPYAYSSDMTGASTHEAKGTWYSNTVDLTNGDWGVSPDGSIVLNVEWDVLLPAGTEITVEYSVTNVPAWIEIQNGDGIAGKHDSIQFKISLRSLGFDVSPSMLELRMRFQPW